jgi:hypothetical protein
MARHLTIEFHLTMRSSEPPTGEKFPEDKLNIQIRSKARLRRRSLSFVSLDGYATDL